MSENFDDETENETTEERLTRFYKIVENTVATLFNKKEAFKTEEEKKQRKGNKIPKNIRILMRKKTSTSKKILKSNKAQNTLKLMLKLKDIEEELEVSYKAMRLKKEREALGKIKRNPKYFYKYANKFSKIQNRVGPLINEKGESIKEPYLMAEVLRKQYESTFSKKDPHFNIEQLDDLFGGEEEGNEYEDARMKKGDDEDEDEENSIGEAEEEEDELNEEERKEREEEANMRGPLPLYDAPFDYMDIVDAINQLSESSGPGPDGISAILLKKSKITVALMLKNIFQHSIENSDIPSILKQGFICPILKPNSRRDKAVSWRPVSLTSHVMKTMERVIRKRIVNHLEVNNLMNINQHGSRRNKSCLSQLLEHHDQILKMLEEGGNVDVVYTDFEKAYEKVSHEKLMEKMKTQYNITGKMAKWLQDFFSKRTQKVLIEEVTSEESKVVSGAVQGSVLGPVFFLMYIGDITDQVKADMKLFVDDAKVKKIVKSEDDVEELQEDLNTLYKWEKENHMKLNGAKFQLLRYGTDTELKNNTVYFTGEMEEIIDQFSSLRDLGVRMSDDAKFDEHIENVSKKVRQKIGWILRTFYT